MQIIDSSANERAKRIKLFVMDVDGTMTDGAMYYGETGEVLKRFSAHDGMGVTLLHRSQIESAIITSENSQIVVARAKKLGVSHVKLGSRDKVASLRELSAATKVDLADIAYIGDDVNDELVMKCVGLAACVADAVQTIRNISHVVSSKNGGHGAIREFAEFILAIQGKPLTLPANW